MRRPAALCLIAATLTGCALPAENLRRAGLSWELYDEPENARLLLGVPDTQILPLEMICRPHSGAVDITIFARSGDSADVQLHSGKVWNRYLGAGHADEERTDGLVISLQKLSAADPVLAAFADTGELTIAFQLRRIVLPNAFAPAHDFMAICRLP